MYCGHCGAERTTKFCSQCGAPAENWIADRQPASPPPVHDEPDGRTRRRPKEPAETASYDMPPIPPPPSPVPAPSTPPPPPPAPSPQPPSHTPSPTSAAPRAQSSAVPAWFSPRDLAYDVLAFVLIFTSFALPWDIGAEGIAEVNDRWWVMLAMLPPLFGLALPYLGATGAISVLTPRLVRTAKLVALGPLALCVLLSLVLELVHVTDVDGGGIGTGVALACFAGLLATLPRRYDDLPVDDVRWRRGFRITVIGGLSLLIGTWLISTLRFLTSDYLSGDGFYRVDAWGVVLTLFGSALGLVVPFVIAGVLALRTAAPGARVLVTAAAAYLFVAVFGRAPESSGGLFAEPDVPTFLSPEIERLGADPAWTGPTAGGTFVLVAVAALALGRWRGRTTVAQDPVGDWLRTARLAALVSGATMLIVAAMVPVTVITTDNELNGRAVAIVVMLAVSGALALAAAQAVGDVRGRQIGMGLAGGWLVLGFAVVGTVSGSSAQSGVVTILLAVSPLEAFLVLASPILVLAALAMTYVGDRLPQPSSESRG